MRLSNPLAKKQKITKENNIGTLLAMRHDKKRGLREFRHDRENKRVFTTPAVIWNTVS